MDTDAVRVGEHEGDRIELLLSLEFNGIGGRIEALCFSVSTDEFVLVAMNIDVFRKWESDGQGIVAFIFYQEAMGRYFDALSEECCTDGAVDQLYFYSAVFIGVFRMDAFFL